jgi:hypothetical protein
VVCTADIDSKSVQDKAFKTVALNDGSPSSETPAVRREEIMLLACSVSRGTRPPKSSLPPG